MGFFFNSAQSNNFAGFVKADGDGTRDVRNLANDFSVKTTMAGYNFNATNGLYVIPFNGGGFNRAKGFTSGDAGNVGFRFKIGGNIHYGWAKFTMTLASPNTLVISEWAYNDVSGGAIQVGAVPEPAETSATLALLAAGAAGVRRWRKRKKAAAATA